MRCMGDSASEVPLQCGSVGPRRSLADALCGEGGDIEAGEIGLGDLERVAEGEEFLIARAGKPVARLIGYREERRARVGGQWKGQVRIDTSFDEPLPL